MSKRVRKKPVRPISSRRDYDSASVIAKRLAGETQRDSAAELRLQALLRELDKFDDTEDDAGDDPAKDYDSSGPRRRWSDEASSDD